MTLPERFLVVETPTGIELRVRKPTRWTWRAVLAIAVPSYCLAGVLLADPALVAWEGHAVEHARRTFPIDP